jgi:hypothetical protein
MPSDELCGFALSDAVGISATKSDAFRIADDARSL